MADKFQVLEDGMCVCIKEPRCDHGLEGYNLNGDYRYQKVRGPKGNHARVWPGEDDGDNYYETCGWKVFQYYFRPKQ